ncbi:hypothetical protein MBRA1_002902 [Malassezia brasiliensis]|uniref:CRAL-TRIO domain-containing protein n=1 Tax=Malassezia brasiliensis TaxID=1821822 RepID=A0AAF0DUY4_9BASI|nr:hypothetical protein MBRA1_002902 [Malassezia brasiliensis]
MSEPIPVKPVQPLPGHYGNLTAEQKCKVAQMWELFFSVIENPEKAKSGHVAAQAEHGEDHTHGYSEEDKDKAKKAQQEEQEALQALFKTHGVDEFYNQFWFLCGPDVPDMVMLKFLRARKWNVHRAFAMLAQCIKWRIETDVIELLRQGDEGLIQMDEKYALQLEAEKAYGVGATDDLMPIIYIDVKRHMAKQQGADTMTRFVIASAESFRCLMTHPSDKIVIIFDVTGFGMKNLDWHTLNTILKILEAYYPETLRKLYIHNAPWIFQGIWKVVRPMLDPVVREKIVFSSRASDIDLVPTNRLMTSMGGTLAGGPKYTKPKPNENRTRPVGDPERERVWNKFMGEVKAYEKTTRAWIQSDGQDETLEKERDFGAKCMRLAWMEVDPLVRGLNNYHRAGIITPEFTLHWEYKQKDGKVLTHDLGKERSKSALQKEIAANGGMRGTSDGAQGKTAPGERYASTADDVSSGDAAATGGVAAGMAGVGAVGAGAAAQSRDARSDGPTQDWQHGEQAYGAPAEQQPDTNQTDLYGNDPYLHSAYEQGAYISDAQYAHGQPLGVQPSYVDPHAYDQTEAHSHAQSSSAFQAHPVTDTAMGAGAGVAAGAAVSAGAGIAAGAALGTGAALGAGAGYALGQPSEGDAMATNNSLSYLKSFIGGHSWSSGDLSTHSNNSSARNSTDDLFHDAPGTPGEWYIRPPEPKEVKHDGARGYDLTHGHNFDVDEGVEGDADDAREQRSAHLPFDEQIAEGGMTAHGADIAKEKSPLAGFPYFANGGGAEEVAEANRRARESAQKARERKSFFSRLNCCGGKHVD